MKYTYRDLGYLNKGRTIVISLQGSQANVKLMDSSNYQNYKNGRTHRYIGGLATRSPIELTTNKSAHWYITIDLGGFKGNVKTSIEVLPAPLPEIPQTTHRINSARTLADLIHTPIQEVGDNNEIFDVFISHASEDKEEIVRPLAEALRKKNVKVWYDEFTLGIGSKLRKQIDKGITNSRFGIVILSKDFIQKDWTNYELDGIVSKELSGEQVILPIWHNITKQEILKYSPSLYDKLARSTTTHTIEEIASEIAALVENKS